jgi:hypothetical protein
MVAAADIRRTALAGGQSNRDRREIPLANPRGKHEAIGMGWYVSSQGHGTKPILNFLGRRRLEH